MLSRAFYLSLGLSELLGLLQLEGVLLNIFQPEVTTESHQKLQAIHAVWKPPVDLFVALQCLLVAACKVHRRESSEGLLQNVLFTYTIHRDESGCMHMLLAVTCFPVATGHH